VQACCAAAVTVPQRVCASEKSPASRHSWDMASGCRAGGTVSRAIPAPREIAFLVRSWCFHSLRRSYYIRTAGPGRFRSARAAAAPDPAPSIHPGQLLEPSRAPRRQGAFRRHKFFFLSLSPVVRTPLWRCGWAGGAPARSNGAADGPESRASRWLRRAMCYIHVCGEWLASCVRAAHFWHSNRVQLNCGVEGERVRRCGRE